MIAKKNQKTTTFFVKKVDKKTTSLVFQNLIVKTFLQYSESPSLHSNLVKTILTSINFDSLSRKIKSPCLTIKKFISKGVCNMKHTKNILKSLLITVMALSLLAVSCKKDEGGSKPTDPTPKNSEALLTEMLQRLGKLTPGSGDTTVILDFATMVFDGKGAATIEGANKTYATVKTVLANVLKTETFQKEQIGLNAVPTIPAKPNNSDPLSVDIVFKANAGYTFDDSITGTGKTTYTYNGSDKTAKLTLKITPAKDWE